MLAELRHAARGLRRSPLFAGVAVLSLGLALALNTTMFALVDAVLHPHVPYPAPERLYMVWVRGDDPGRYVDDALKADAIRASLRLAEGSTLYSGLSSSLTTALDSEDALVGAVGPEFFDVVGVRPYVGRTFRPDDAAQHAAIISFALWRRAFGERPLGEGLTIEVGDSPFTVVGVMPPGMHVGARDVWIPDDAAAALKTHSPPRALLRVRADASMDAVRAELNVVTARLTTAHGSSRYPLTAQLIDMGAKPPRLDVFYIVMVVTAAVVLVIACANLATLLLARGEARRRELAIRLALGASRGAVMRHVMLECGILVAGGAALGLLLGRWSLQLAARWAPPFIPQLGEYVPTPSWRVFALTLTAAFAVLVLAGVAPALRAAATPPAEPMKDGGGSTGRRRRRYSTLIIAEVALATALLMTAALFGMSSYRLATYQFRMNAQRLVIASALWNEGDGTETARAARIERTYADLLTRLRSVDDVRDVATRRNQSPHQGMVVGENGAAGVQHMNLRGYEIVSPGYLRTVGIPVIDGRDFAEGDASGPGVAIVDAAAARRLWPNLASPVGRMLKLGSERSRAPWVRVIGVTPSVAAALRHETDALDDPDIRVVAPGAMQAREIVVAGDATGAALPVVVRRELRRALPNAYVRVERFLAGHEEKIRFQSFLALLYCALSAFALVLCAVGLYGALAYSVSLRLREFSIRASLGATRRHLLPNVVHEAAVTALAGVGIGAFGALWATRYVMDALYPIAFVEVKALAIAEAILLLVAALAASQPVTRAVRANPAEALQAT